MAESLLNSKNPLALYHKIFVERTLRPFLEAQRQMQVENANRERLIIRQQEFARARQLYIRDCRWGLLHANKLVGKQAHDV